MKNRIVVVIFSSCHQGNSPVWNFRTKVGSVFGSPQTTRESNFTFTICSPGLIVLIIQSKNKVNLKCASPFFLLDNQKKSSGNFNVWNIDLRLNKLNSFNKKTTIYWQLWHIIQSQQKAWECAHVPENQKKLQVRLELQNIFEPPWLTVHLWSTGSVQLLELRQTWDWRQSVNSFC